MESRCKKCKSYNECLDYSRYIITPIGFPNATECKSFESIEPVTERLCEQNEVLNAWKLLKSLMQQKGAKLVPSDDFIAGYKAAYKDIEGYIDHLIELEENR